MRKMDPTLLALVVTGLLFALVGLCLDIAGITKDGDVIGGLIATGACLFLFATVLSLTKNEWRHKVF